MTGGGLDVVVARISRVDHETIDELHRLGTLTTQLAGDDDLATLGAGLHDETEHTVAGTTDGQSSGELVTQRLSLGNGAQATGGHLLGVQLDASGLEVETLLHHGGQLTDAAALLAQHLLGLGGHDDDLSARGGHTHLHAGVAILGEFTSQELVQFSLEDAIGNELWDGMGKRKPLLPVALIICIFHILLLFHHALLSSKVFGTPIGFEVISDTTEFLHFPAGFFTQPRENNKPTDTALCTGENPGSFRHIYLAFLGNRKGRIHFDVESETWCAEKKEIEKGQIAMFIRYYR